MELLHSGKLKNKARLYMKRAIGYKNCELEFVYGSNPGKGKIERDDFLRVLENLKQKFEVLSEETTLDIQTNSRDSLGNIRFTIRGLEDIKKYCKTNSFENILNLSYTKKNVYEDENLPSLDFNTIIDYNYNYRINLKQEEELHEDNHLVQKTLLGWSDKLKYFRYKKRTSFLTPDKLFRIDVTAIKSNEYDKKRKKNKLFKSFLESNILKNKEEYELEIEYIGSIKQGDIFPIDIFTEKIYLDEKETFEKMNDLYTENKKGLPEIYDELPNHGSNAFVPEDMNDPSIDQQNIDWIHFIAVRVISGNVRIVSIK